MSITSTYGTMNRAEGLSIGDIVKGIQNGSIPSYVGIPLVEKKTKEAQKLQMAQALMRQLEGGPPSTVTDQVMQAADQVTRPGVPPTTTLPATDRQRPAPSMGIEAVQSNMPQDYAGGGIVAFADRGAVEEDIEYAKKHFTNDPMLGVNPSAIADWMTTPPGGYSEEYKARRAAKDSDYYRTTQPSPSKARELATPQGPSLLDRATGGIDKAADWWHENVVSPASDWMDKQRYVGSPAPTPAPATPAPPKPSLTADNIVRTPAAPSGRAPSTPAMPQTPPQVAPQAASEQADGIGFDKLMQGMRDERQGLKDLILGQQKDREAQSAENRNMALMKAGFGMMAGESPFAGVNIGRGAMAGAESYGRGLEQLRKDDRSIIQQLINAGYKGQELEAQAMKMGIDMSHYKDMQPYYDAMAEQARAHAEYYRQMPGIAALKAARSGGGGGAGGKGYIPGSVVQKEIDTLQGYQANPTEAPFYRSLPKDVRTAIEELPEDHPNRNAAMAIFNRAAVSNAQNRLNTIQSFSVKRPALTGTDLLGLED